MAVKLKLQRIGKLRTPHYRIIVADSRSKRGGKAIENLGIYQPKVEPSYIRLDSERVQYWLCLLYTSPSPRDKRQSRMPSSA